MFFLIWRRWSGFWWVYELKRDCCVGCLCWPSRSDGERERSLRFVRFAHSGRDDGVVVFFVHFGRDDGVVVFEPSARVRGLSDSESIT